MAALGRNVKITAGRSQRDSLRDLFGGVFGCERATPTDELDLFTFSDGAHLGAYYVPDDAALSPDQLLRGAWLELAVENPDAAAVALAVRGLVPFDYVDKEHNYYQAPGGQVFRLAPLQQDNEEESR